MSQLAQIRRSIKSIKTTKKITHAMRLVSMSLYSRLEGTQRGYDELRSYVRTLISRLIATSPEWTDEILIPQARFDSTPLIIFISTTKGLCGTFHNILARYFENKCPINKKSFIHQGGQDPFFITIGTRGTDFINKKIVEWNRGKIIKSYSEVTPSHTAKISSDIVEAIYSAEKIFSSVTIYSNRFVNFFSHPPSITEVLPLTTTMEEHKPQVGKRSKFKKTPKEIDVTQEFVWEQEKDTTLRTIARQYVRIIVEEAIISSITAEHSARFSSMDGATQNATKMIDQLSIKANKMRQALITKEVAELSSNL
ncbi:F0F1 ATP synthase subunit gamma [bacterium]|nr:F0F1 ATP synthase subunit gamma [bacterium]